MEDGEDLDGEWFIFSPDDDMKNPHYVDHISKQFVKVQKQHGLPHITIQTLRKYVGSVVIRQFGPSVTQKVLRHRSATTSIRNYVGNMEGDDRAVTDYMEQIAHYVLSNEVSAGLVFSAGLSESKFLECPKQMGKLYGDLIHLLGCGDVSTGPLRGSHFNRTTHSLKT
jgi:hypothetical protein